MADTSKDDELDLLGDEDVESFTGSHADLEGAADNLLPVHVSNPYVLRHCLQSPAKTVPPTPALQQKIEPKLEKSLGNQINIQLQQQMGAFQASMFEAMKSLRDEFQSMKKTLKTVEVDQTPTLASRPGTSEQTDTLAPNTASNTAPNKPSKHMGEAMELDTYSPPLPPWFGDALSKHGSDPNHFRIINETSPNNLDRCAQLGLKNMWTSINTKFGQSIFLSCHLQRRISSLFTGKGLLSPRGPLLNKTIYIMIHTGKWPWLT